MLVANAQPAAAQVIPPWSFGVGGGRSIITGTPDRPRPQEGDLITGASGPEQGVHVRLLVERAARSWLHFRAEAFWNRLTTTGKAFNCFLDVEQAPGGGLRSGRCYPAAVKDVAVGGTIGGRLAAPAIPLKPSAVFGVGVARYNLVDDQELYPGIQGVTNVRPLLKGGVTLEYGIGGVRLMAEAALQTSLGAGGGTDHIPITLTLMF